MKLNQIFLASALGGILATVFACSQMMHEDEKPIAFEKTPPAVQTAITKVLAGQKADKIVMEELDGKPIYEVTYRVNGQECSAEFTPTGDMIEQESDLDVAKLPAVITNTVQAKYPGAKIEEAADVNADGQRFYEAGIKLSDGKEHEVQINADGSIRADKAEESKKWAK